MKQVTKRQRDGSQEESIIPTTSTVASTTILGDVLASILTQKRNVDSPSAAGSSNNVAIEHIPSTEAGDSLLCVLDNAQ